MCVNESLTVMCSFCFSLFVLHVRCTDPAIALQSLSLWNCQTIGGHSFLVRDLTVKCEGSKYQVASAFNVFFVVTVILGWPVFLIWCAFLCYRHFHVQSESESGVRAPCLFDIRYLRRIQISGRFHEETMADRIGFLYKKYRPDFIFWDVFETLRKLYLVTVVAFFPAGSMAQLTLSILVSNIAIMCQVYYQPFIDGWLNQLQMLALLLIWVTLQAGIAVQFGGTKDPTSSVTIVLVQIGSIILVVAPVLLFILVGVKLVPKKIRTQVSIMFGVPMDDDGPSRSDSIVDEGDQRFASTMSRNDSIMSRSDSIAEPERVSDTPGIELSDMSGSKGALADYHGDETGSSHTYPPTIGGSDVLAQHSFLDVGSLQSSILHQSQKERPAIRQ
jgi:hypothetical protein